MKWLVAAELTTDDFFSKICLTSFEVKLKIIILELKKNFSENAVPHFCVTTKTQRVLVYRQSFILATPLYFRAGSETASPSLMATW